MFRIILTIPSVLYLNDVYAAFQNHFATMVPKLTFADKDSVIKSLLSGY